MGLKFKSSIIKYVKVTVYLGLITKKMCYKMISYNNIKTILFTSCAFSYLVKIKNMDNDFKICTK